MKRIVLIIALVIGLAAATCVGGAALLMSNAVSDDAKALMDETVAALVADDAEALAALLDPTVVNARTEAGVLAVIRATPDGPVEHVRLRSFSFSSEGAGAARVARTQALRAYQFGAGPAWITFDIIEDARGARLLGLNVSRTPPSDEDDDAPSSGEEA